MGPAAHTAASLQDGVRTRAHEGVESAISADAAVGGATRRRVMVAGAPPGYGRDVKAIRRFTVRPVLPDSLRPLSDLARNLRWSWHPETRELFQAVDSDGWRRAGGDPVRMLASVSAERISELAGDHRFLRRLASAAADLHDYLDGRRWYQTADGDPRGAGPGRERPTAIAYFSPEFGITAALPQYSGGLGILAGDHLKAASDLGVPLIGVGLLYRHGYFRQSLSREGWQQEHYPVLDPNELPLTMLREADGAPAQIALALPGGGQLRAVVWQAQVGRVPLLLLDSHVEDNGPGEREVTDRLYGGGSEHRLLQEMLLGIGGVRAVRAYCRLTGHPAPEVFHTNEGHAGFLGLERIRELAEEGLEFDAALETVRAGTVFTTHTPVPAGIDRFDRDLVARHFGDDGELPGIDPGRVLALGTESYPGGKPDLFNMAVMGLRLAQRANGVSTLHGQVSREMFAGLWPGFDAEEVPITSVTNGVHAPTWVAPEVLRLGARQIGGGRAEDALSVGGSERWEAVRSIPDTAIWELRRTLREQLVAEVRERLRASWRERGAGSAELGWIDDVLSPDVLTIGFARRVPSYKRLTLMLRDPDRLRDLLLHPERPIQIVVAGKAHPADEGGKRLIQELRRRCAPTAGRRVLAHGGDGVVEVLGVVGVDRERGQVAQVHARVAPRPGRRARSRPRRLHRAGRSGAGPRSSISPSTTSRATPGGRAARARARRACPRPPARGRRAEPAARRRAPPRPVAEQRLGDQEAAALRSTATIGKSSRRPAPRTAALIALARPASSAPRAEPRRDRCRGRPRP